MGIRLSYYSEHPFDIHETKRKKKHILQQ